MKEICQRQNQKALQEMPDRAPKFRGLPRLLFCPQTNDVLCPPTNDVASSRRARLRNGRARGAELKPVSEVQPPISPG